MLLVHTTTPSFVFGGHLVKKINTDIFLLSSSNFFTPFHLHIELDLFVLEQNGNFKTMLTSKIKELKFNNLRTFVFSRM